MSRRPLSTRDLQRPQLPAPSFTAPEPTTLALLAERYGITEKNDFQIVAGNIVTLSARVDSIIGLWGRLTLLDPANGQITTEDRAQARLAAADIKAQRRGIEIISDFTLPSFRRLDVPPQNYAAPGNGPARSCAAIWRSGRIDPPLTME